jgi:pyruvate formate lyase activating enzyme
VWQEFIIDTAKLARRHGILILYKSAFYISLEAVEELIEWMDVFSLSLKSMNHDFYRKLTQGTLEPVLEAIKRVYKSGKHLEVSNLMVTDANDSPDDALQVADWVLENCSDQTPVHFVRFHPDYKYTHVERTPIDRLARARDVAMARGLKYVYMGNVFDQAGTHTYCPTCQKRVISRYGMNTRLEGLSSDGHCSFCGTVLPFTALATSFRDQRYPFQGELSEIGDDQRHEWSGDILSFHVETRNHAQVPLKIGIERQSVSNPQYRREETITLRPQESFRFVVSRSDPQESSVRIVSENGLTTTLYDLLDRAHFPTQKMFPLIPLPVAVQKS